MKEVKVGGACSSNPVNHITSIYRVQITAGISPSVLSLMSLRSLLLEQHVPSCCSNPI